MVEGDIVRVNSGTTERVGTVTQVYSSPWWEITFPDGQAELIFRGYIEEIDGVEALYEGVTHGITPIGR